MKSNRKTKRIILLILGIFFALSPVSNNNINSEYYSDITFNKNNVKISKISSPIYINDNDPNYNWSVTKDAGICNGSGTYSDPYVIQDLVIDGGGSGNCILVEYSDVYFKIENCTVYNSTMYVNWDSAGIRLSHVNNSLLINNNCSSNFIGINLENCYNNTISGNTANNNSFGIYLRDSNNNNLSENIANFNGYYGIKLSNCDNNTVSKNIVNYQYLYGMEISSSDNNTISGNTANYNHAGIKINNGYANNITGNTANNNTYYGIYLYRGYYNTISGNNISNNGLCGIDLWITHRNMLLGNIANNNYRGISLKTCSKNIITENTANYNENGFYLEESNYNIISGNTLKGNDQCIVEKDCQGNEFKDNKHCNYGESKGITSGIISGYNLFFLLGILSVAIFTISKKIKKS